MKITKGLAFILLSVFLLNSCKKNNTDRTNQEPLPNDTETVIASVTGIVVNENNIPVQGAIVNLGTQNIVTDNYGMFRFQKIAISKNNGYVRVAKAGYFNGNRNFITTSGRTHNLRIKLLPKTITGSFSSATGGTVALSAGGKVTFPASGITDAGGNAYSGTVNVSMTWINPTATDLGSIIQGDLRGITTDGYERVLETYGMLGVELTDGTGQKLKIATGKTAQISLPIPAALQTTAPTSIPLWYFDETKGRWIQEGSATKTGSNYVGDVAHFSFWNCDLPGPMVTLCINAVNQTNQPLNNISIRLRRVNNPASVSYGFTDSLGNVCGAIPANEALVLEILNNCGQVNYTQNIGPYMANSSLNVVANITNGVTITGTVVNCNNMPVTNGSVLIFGGNANYYNVPVINGSFSVYVLECSGPNTTFSAIPFDYATQQQGNAVTNTVTNGVLNFGQLTACQTSTAVYINTIIDGVPDFFIYQDSLSNCNPFGTPTYSFSRALTGFQGNSYLKPNIQFAFHYNASIGVYPLVNLTVFFNFNNASSQILTPNPVINITEIGPFGTGYLSGNFNVNVLFQPNNVTKNVICNFRVKRC